MTGLGLTLQKGSVKVEGVALRRVQAGQMVLEMVLKMMRLMHMGAGHACVDSEMPGSQCKH